MKLPKFRNAIVYRATLPSIEAIEGHLLELPYSEIGETEFSRASFVPNPITGELVTPISGGYAIVIRHDQKIIPQHVVLKEAAARIQRIEDMSGSKIKRIERLAIIDSVSVDLCKRAFVKSTLILALYSTNEKLLVVNTTNKNIAGMAVAMLVKVVGSVKTETINISDIKNGLTTRLKNYINGVANAFEGFTVGNYIQLSRLADQKEVIHYSAEHDSIQSELVDSLNSGFTADKMELAGCGVSFILTENFHFSRINTQAQTFNDEDDKAFQWRHQAGTDLLQFSKVVNLMCDLLSYKEEQPQKPAA
ncbi:TPA: recombination-associated protein RdgC [Citrobacter braakii]|nr:recombination-associated protein RdgC [Citrobacter braakii]HEF0053147.1 recombination-associated protein RdgC [Citrobacter braakii]